jgi:hypothetical protein
MSTAPLSFSLRRPLGLLAEDGLLSPDADRLLRAHFLLHRPTPSDDDRRHALALLAPLDRQRLPLRRRLLTSYLTARALDGRNTRRALEHYSTALDLACCAPGDMHDEGALLDLLYHRGSAFRRASELYPAAEDFLLCLRILREHAGDASSLDAPFEVDVLARLAGFECLLGRFELASQHLNAARRLMRLAPDAQLELATVQWITALFDRLHNKPLRALDSALAASRVYGRLGDACSSNRLHSLVAEVSLDAAESIGRLGTSAAPYIAIADREVTTALHLARTLNDPIGFELALLAQARLQRLRGDNSNTQAQIERVISMARRLQDAALLVQARSALAEELLAYGEITCGLNMCRKVLDSLRWMSAPALGIPARRHLLRAQEHS